ncbi:hypothetical protein C0995_015085, partial [Termitomyces sp. Mi166
MASLPEEILKGDHTFKLIKYLGCLMGEPTHDAMYTVVNEWKEAHAQALTLTKSLVYVRFDIKYKVETTSQGGPGANPQAQVGQLDMIQIATDEAIYIFK